MNSLFKVMPMQLNRKSRLGHSKTLFYLSLLIRNIGVRIIKKQEKGKHFHDLYDVI